MIHRLFTPLVAASFLVLQCVAAPARADNQMGYQLLTPQQAADLPQNGGRLGMDVQHGRQITDGGMTFEIIQVKTVRPGSAGERAGFTVGDQIIALDRHVFPSIATFAAYVGALPAGRQVEVDYMPANGGPQQAQRVNVTVGPVGGGNGSFGQSSQQDQPVSHGMSTGTKVAIGVGAVALFGCYEAGCFSHKKRKPPQPQMQTQPQTQFQQNGTQQR